MARRRKEEKRREERRGEKNLYATQPRFRMRYTNTVMALNYGRRTLRPKTPIFGLTSPHHFPNNVVVAATNKRATVVVREDFCEKRREERVNPRHSHAA